jgi:hypothetical protein
MVVQDPCRLPSEVRSTSGVGDDRGGSEPYPLKRETTAMEEDPGQGRKGHSTALQEGRRRQSL